MIINIIEYQLNGKYFSTIICFKANTTALFAALLQTIIKS
jgi:hypothetical protein